MRADGEGGMCRVREGRQQRDSTSILEPNFVIPHGALPRSRMCCGPSRSALKAAYTHTAASAKSSSDGRPKKIPSSPSTSWPAAHNGTLYTGVTSKLGLAGGAAQVRDLRGLLQSSTAARPSSGTRKARDHAGGHPEEKQDQALAPGVEARVDQKRRTPEWPETSPTAGSTLDGPLAWMQRRYRLAAVEVGSFRVPHLHAALRRRSTVRDLTKLG